MSKVGNFITEESTSRHLVRNLRSEESREFWLSVDRGAAEVDSWPKWKRLLIAGER